MKSLFSLQYPAVRALVLAISAMFLCGLSARADVVFAWNELLLHLASNSAASIPPQLEVRAFAMAHLAMDEAVTAASRGDLNADGRIAAQRAAAVSAAHAVLIRLLPAATGAIDTLAERHLGSIPAGREKVRGIEIGRTVAHHICERRQHDGWAELTCFGPEAGPRPDSSETAALALARGQRLPPSPWLGAAPFVLKTAKQFQVSEIRTVSRFGHVEMDLFLQYSTVFDRVDHAGAFASREGFWAGKPVIAWNRIARQLSATRGVDLPGQAKLLAMLNVALADTVLSTLHWRHTIGSWRSMVADAWGTVDGMPPRFSDVVVQVTGAWESDLTRLENQRLLIPPTPNYPSVGAAVAGAAQTVLARFFKTDQITFNLPAATRGSGEVDAPRTFASISAAARECAYVASLDGRHLREACIAGYSLGTSIGSYVSKRPLARQR